MVAGKNISLVIVALLFAAPAQAHVKVAGIFTDHTVLQRGKPVPVWGWADPGEQVTVSFGGQEKRTTADEDGTWKVALEPLQASAEPRAMTVKGKDNAVTLNDVVVGEVWFFSGQSNMALRMGAIAKDARGLDPASSARVKQDIAAASDPLLREINVLPRAAENPREDTLAPGGWLPCDRKTAGEFAAMGFYAGQKLRQHLNVPVGILMCSWGGSGTSAWISPKTLRAPELRSLWPEDVVQWRNNIAPTRLHNGMLRPLVPFAIAGFGWYQGETEAAEYHNPFICRFLLTAMIQDWRRLWRDPNLPFYIVQLPNRNNEPRWVIVRESQAYALRLPHTGMIPTIDIGTPGDLHPKNKFDVGHRFADLILAKEYGKDTWSGSPSFDRMARDGNAVRIHLRDADKGLRTTDKKPPTAFLVAGEDRQFKPASARIDGTSVVVSSDEVPSPVAVRYAWEPAPAINLTGAGGLPVVPFRTDTWPVDGEEMVGRELPVKETLATVVRGRQLMSGTAGPWHPSPDAAVLSGEHGKLFTKPGGGDVGVIIVRGRVLRAGLPASPKLLWTAEPDVDPAKGLTVDVKALVNRVGNAERGLDIEVGIVQPDRSLRRYLVTVFPVRVHTFQTDELRVLRSDLESDTAVYRLAVRPDGIAQIYRDAELLGTTSGETVEAASIDGATPNKSYVKIGKSVATGEWMVNIHHAALDTGGAFMPPASLKSAPAGTGRTTDD
jgi:sialate O-acetylesterase